MVDRRKSLKIKEDWAKRVWRDTVSDADSSQLDVDRRVSKIERELTQRSENEFGVYLVGCSALAHAKGKQAIKEFSNLRTADGWRRIAESLIYSLTEFKIDYALRFPSKSSLEMDRAGLIYCTAIVLKSREVAEWAANFIIETERNSKSKMRPVDPNAFQYLCYQFASETCPAKSQPVWGQALSASFYGPLLEARGIDEVQAAIGPAVVARAGLTLPTVSDETPFEWSPFNLFPVDILAILLMRHSDQIEFDFGCMESPLCHPPVELNWEKPEIVQRIEARIREEHEYPAIDWR